MISNINPAQQQFLANLSRTQAQSAQAQQQVSSGFKVEYALDSPDQISALLQLEAKLASNAQTSTNLNTVTTEVNTAQTAVNSAVGLLEAATSLGAQGAGSLKTADARLGFAQQVQSILTQLVETTSVTDQGRYVFSGDQDGQPTYRLNLASATGVDRLASVVSSRQIRDGSGELFAAGQTAQNIFDRRNPDDSIASGNVFAAVNSLRTALAANDTAGIATALDSLHAASTYLNSQLTFYGTLQDRLNSAVNEAQNQALSIKAGIGQIRDADITQAAISLSQSNSQQQAALAAEAKVPRTSLFDLLG